MFGIWTIALTYGLSVLAGFLMVHSGNRYALDFRDKLVGTAQHESVIYGNFIVGTLQPLPAWKRPEMRSPGCSA